MGRETRILLALLGLLAGVFLGVVSLKLFVPRPPAGTGPDVHADIASAEAQDLVEPPGLVPPAAAVPPAHDSDSGPTRRFASTEPAELPPPDPFVRPASFESLAEADPPPEPPPAAIMDEPADLLPPPLSPPSVPPDATPDRPALFAAEPAPPAAFEPQAPSRVAGLPDGHHVAQPGDSWWSLAEKAYGDGRLYRALFAWNKALDARVSLAPGTRLEIPPVTRLAATWPGLVPQD
jgi:5'-nucleotidase/UDP-sugar diphosphatase